jgi:hypothetical protein
MKKIVFLTVLSIIVISNYAQLNSKTKFTLQDTLRGSLNEYRTWWDVQHYNIIVQPNYESQIIKASVAINFKVDSLALTALMFKGEVLMQLDLQDSLQIDSIIYQPKNNFKAKHLVFTKQGNVYWVNCTEIFQKFGFDVDELIIFYKGKPRIANNPPWDGGWIWKKDAG